MDALDYSGQYLGCDHRVSDGVVDNVRYEIMTYDMAEFLGSCIEKYEEIVGRIGSSGSPLLPSSRTPTSEDRANPVSPASGSSVRGAAGVMLRVSSEGGTATNTCPL